MDKDFECMDGRVSDETKRHLLLHRVKWVLIGTWHPNFNQWACYNKYGEFLYNEDFPKHINPNLTYPCGQHTIAGVVPIEYRDIVTAVSKI